MTPVVKDFDAHDGKERAPSCAFRLGGRQWHCRNANDVPITLVDQALSASAAGSWGVQVAAFFEGIIVPGEVEEFLALVRGPRCPLTAGNTVPLITWISEQVLARPTGRPAPSGRGPRSTAARSTAVSSSPATRRRRSSA